MEVVKISNYIKNYLSLILLLFLVNNCNFKKNTSNKKYKMIDQDIKKIENLLKALNDENLSINQVLDKHYMYANNLKQASDKDSILLLDAYILKFTELRKDLKQNKCHAYSWIAAEKKDKEATKNLLESDVVAENVFVIFVNEKPKYYIKMKDKKVESLTPLLKGNKISGWL